MQIMSRHIFVVGRVLRFKLAANPQRFKQIAYDYDVCFLPGDIREM